MDKLKAIARELGAEPVGDRRKHQTWELAIERQAQIMDIPIDAAYNPIFRTTLLGGRNRVSFEVIEQALGLVEHQCYPRLHGPIQEPIFNSPGAQLAAKVFPGIACFQNLTETSPAAEVDRAQEPIESSDTLAAPFGVEIEALALPESSDIWAASSGVESEPVVLSDRFLAFYSPPQVKIRYKPDADGQLNLLDFQVESVVEFPDPDDFESLDAFREAIALWDLQQPIDVSLDSFTYWAPCSDDWYEPAGENSFGVDRVQALERKNISGVDRVQALERKNISGVEFDCVQALFQSSSTSDFFIPVFGGCDRNNDEPPTAGVGARLPKPKPPSFPPAHTKRISNAYQTHSCFVGAIAGYSGRSPPGGDAIA